MAGMVHVVTLGKVRSPFAAQAVEHYLTLLQAGYQVRMQHLPEPKAATGNAVAQRSAAGKLLEAQMQPDAANVLLTERGRCYTTLELSTRLGGWFDQGRHLRFLLGGAFGFPEELDGKATLALSLSPLTFPHEIALVLLLEQLYRVHTLRSGKAYHY